MGMIVGIYLIFKHQFTSISTCLQGIITRFLCLLGCFFLFGPPSKSDYLSPIHLNEELFMAAQEREDFTEKTLKKMQIINAETRSMQEVISLEKQDIFTMKESAEAELEAAAGFRKRVISLRKELNKARAKIRRLENKQ